jgi:hypothetical protein
VVLQEYMMSIIGLVLWEVFAIVIAISLKSVVEKDIKESDRVFVAMCFGAFIAAIAISPFTPIF